MTGIGAASVVRQVGYFHPPALIGAASDDIWAVYGRGSYFAGAPNPKDVDIVVVTKHPVTREAALERLRPALAALDVPGHLPLDLHVTQLDELTVIERAVIAQGHHLDGDDVRATIAAVTWPEWAHVMRRWFIEARSTEPAAAALAAVRGALVPIVGVLALSKYLVPDAAENTRWEDLARAAWSYRGRAADFDHVDLDDAGRACATTAAGDAFGDVGDAGPLGVVYWSVFQPEQLQQLAARTPTPDTFDGGRWKGPCSDTKTAGALWTLAQIANQYRWRRPLTGCEHLELHRYPVGTTFPKHVDRMQTIPLSMRVAFPDASLGLLRTRVANVVCMVQPASAGGQLRISSAGGPPFAPQLGPGDVVIFDGSAPHEVTRVDDGERLVLVTHTHDG